MAKEMRLWDNITIWKDFKDLSFQNRHRIEQVISLVPSDSNLILELGCGFGYVCNRLIKKYHIIGIDHSIRVLKHVTSGKVLASCETLPFKNNCFDTIIASELLEHLDDENLIKTIREIERLARKYVLISVPYKEEPWETFVKCASCGNVYSLYGHKQFFDEKRMKSLFPKSRNVKILFCGKNRRSKIVKKFVHRLDFYNYRKITICMNCGCRRLAHAELSRIITFLVKAIGLILGRTEPLWMFGIYKLTE
ncbi:class I SAM-dependent methyltransferase [[Eubacterium] cellulosolvens]